MADYYFFYRISIINKLKFNLIMDWEYGHEKKECTCRYCGEDSNGEFCDRECAKAYEADN